MSDKVTVTDRESIRQSLDEAGQHHSVNDEPSLIDPRGTAHWHKHGVLHRDGDKPAVDSSDVEVYYKNGKIHRDGDKPAIIENQGVRVFYYKEDKIHRTTGPAIIHKVGKDELEQFWMDGKKYDNRRSWEHDGGGVKKEEAVAKVEAPKVEPEAVDVPKEEKKVEAKTPPKAPEVEAPKKKRRGGRKAKPKT